MKIGVNARMLAYPYTGIGQYTIGLFRELGELDPKDEYILVTHQEPEEWVVAGFPPNVRVKVLEEKTKGGAGMRKTWWEQIQLPEFFEKEKVEIAFFTYPANPWTSDWYKKGIKTAITVHDCIPWTEKNYRKKLLAKFYYGMTRRAVKKADIVFTVSEFSKKEIKTVCGTEKAKVVYNDAADTFKTSSEKDSSGPVLKKNNLKSGKYILYAGGFDERKNVKKLLKEYELFASKNPDIPLVMPGGKLFENKLYESFDGSGSGEIVKPGFVEARELKVLYENCLAFVHLSKEEGFNIPIIEAANCGAPLILSDIDVHKEIAGDSALFVNVDKDKEAAKAMELMLGEEARKKWSEKSKKLAEKYSWKKSAQEVKEVLFSS